VNVRPSGFQIAEPARIKERNGTTASRQIIEPHNRCGLEQIEVAIRTYFQVTEIGASFCQCRADTADSSVGVASICPAA
jgi:hypothetical protein